MMTIQLKTALQKGHCAFYLGQFDPILINPGQFLIMASKLGGFPPVPAGNLMPMTS